ncbi:MAG: low molecular weight phosphotyrosine protein phosphatase [Chloroflexi bacterium]|nr:low molecular weight phosphotyrosine protein phosphatase [Chloroflexota bacterium]
MAVKKICFVCLGNICRSPLAEHMFNHVANEMGLGDKYQARSAGTAGWHVGEPPDERMRRVAASRGLVYNGSGRQFTRQDFDNYDLIIAMDSDNKRQLMNLARSDADRSKIRLMREFDPQGGPGQAVPDPYYGGINGFEEVYDIVERSVRGLLEALEKGEV